MKDESSAFIEDLEFKNIRENAISLYRKNPRYSIGGTIDGQQLQGITVDDVNLDSSSLNYIDNDAYLPLLDSK